MQSVKGLGRSEEMERTQKWVDENAIQITEKVRVTFGTRCKCGRNILEEVNEQHRQNYKGWQMKK